MDKRASGLATLPHLIRRAFAVASILVFLLITITPRSAFAYPDAEVLGSGGTNPPFDFGVTSTQSGLVLVSDRRLAISYGESLVLVDTGFFALESSQPPALSSDDETDGIIADIDYVSAGNVIVASQEDGDLLVFRLDEVTEKPASIELSEGDTLGPLAVDADKQLAYVANNSDMTIHVVDLLSSQLTTTISLTIAGESSFYITDAIFVDETNEAYFTTDAGAVFYIPAGGATASLINVDVTGGIDLSSIAAFSNGAYLYAVDSNTPAVVKISTSTHDVVLDDIDISANTDPTDMVIAKVTNPDATYAFVAGASGVSVINTSNDEVLDLGDDEDVDGEPLPTSTEPLLLAASSSTDGYVYMGLASLKVGLLSANPLVTISDLTYSGEDQTLGLGESFTVTFSSDRDGDYEVRAGGSVDAGGTVLVDDTGATTGSVTADTPVSVTIGYDDNSSAFEEGANDLWVFVTSGTDRGRRATSLSVDTPPPVVVIRSTGFGNGRIYVTFDRLDVADLASYSIYVDPDPTEVLVKDEAQATVSQTAFGDTLTAETSDLISGTVYYIAMDAVDAAGNRSATRTNTLADGTLAYEIPEVTFGPAGFLGESGCSLYHGGAARWPAAIIILLAIALAGLTRFRAWRLGILLIGLSFIISGAVLAQEKGPVEEKEVAAVGLPGPSPQMWSLELKTGFWIPKNVVLDRFFTKCCNMWTRVQGGLLINQRYGVELGAGVLYKTGRALGVDSGRVSNDRFSFLLIPLETSFAWRADYFDWRYLVPYAKAGFDAVVFREGLTGRSTTGVKFGMHTAGGVAVNIGAMADVSRDLGEEYGINDMFLTLEAQYHWIDNFGGKGLDLSGQLYSIGLLFEF